MVLTHKAPASHCPLCGHAGTAYTLRSVHGRPLAHCSVCDLVFANPEVAVDAAEERRLYQTHQNSIEQPGYIDFLNRLVEPMAMFVQAGAYGVDYGSGPGPTLSTLMQRRGYGCHDYDPMFGPHELAPPYDFVTCTECFEHFTSPAKTIQHIVSLLKPQGVLGIMTDLWNRHTVFETWYYTKDPTHVVFYSLATIDYLCSRFGLALLYSDAKRVLVFRTMT